MEGMQGQYPGGPQGGEPVDLAGLDLPPPPPDIAVGDPSQQIGGMIPPGATGDGGEEGGEEGDPSNRRASASAAAAASGKEITETDNQEMPGNIGGTQGSNRGVGVEEGDRMSTEL